MKQKLLNNLKLRAVWLVAMILCAVTGAWADEVIYTFTANSWTATSGGNAANWTAGKNGAGFSNNGIQVTTSATGAYGTSPEEYSNISKIVVTYNTNKSAGAGSIDVKIGNNDATSNNVAFSGSADGRTANFTTEYNYDAPQSGAVKLTVNTITNSIYLVSVAITYSSGGGSSTYSVTYNANGATSGEVPSDDNEYEEGDEVTVLGNTGSLAKTGCAFGGWNTQANGEGDSYDEDDIFEITANTKLYAQWIPYTITAASNNDSYGTVSLSGSVITATPATGYTYASPAYSVSPANSATVAQDGNTFTVTPTADTEVTINFEALPTYTVTFGDGGSVAQETPGAEVTLPSRSAISSYTFAGWSETNVTSETTTAPTIIPAGSYTPTANITLYPVYSKTEGGGGTVNKSASVNIGTYATSNSWTNSTQYENISLDENVTATANGGGNTGKYYSSNNSWRLYANETATLVIALAEGTLTSVTITYTGNKLTYNDEDITSGTSFGLSGNSAIIAVSGSSSNSQVTAISVDYTISGGGTTYYWSAPVAAAVERPTIEVAANPFLFSTTATITCETEGAAIKYSYDNENWNNYTEALTITATTTIYAKAVKNQDESSVASVTATKNLAEPTVAIDATGITNTNVYTGTEAGSLAASVTYNDAAVAGAAVTWSGNNDEVATIDEETGEVTLVGAGSVTFVATYAGNSDYSEKTATYVMTVTSSDPNAPGTVNNPYTVAQARAAIDAGTGVTGVYATGIVSQIVTAYNSTYGNISYNISADGLTTSDQLQAYRGFDKDGEWFTSADDVQVGDVVVIYGNLTKYNTTYEFAQNNQRYSYSRKDEAGLAYETEAYNANLGEAFATPELTNPNSLTVTYSSSDESVATVDAEGAVTLVAAGETIITATFEGNESYKAGEASYTLTVIDPNEPVDICELVSITPTTLTIDDMGDFVLTANFVDGVVEGVDYEISWTSSDPAVLDLAGTTYEAVAAGTVTITVNVEVYDEDTYNNVSKEFTVKVEAPKTWVALVSEYDGEYYAMNKEFSNGTYQSTKVDVVNGKVINGEANDISWSIEASGNGVSIQNRTTENFVGYSSSTNLTKSANPYEWTVDEENNSWTVSTTRSIIMNSSYGFKAYAISNLQPNQTGYANIYTTAYTFARGYTREVTANNFGTICLPYDVAAEDFSGVKFYQIVAKKMNGNNVTSVVLSDEVTSLVGGAAYIYQANADAVKLIAAYSGYEVAEPFDAEISKTGLTGTYEAAYIPVDKYVLKDNTLFYVDQANYVKSGANKAYIDLDNVPEADANVKGIRIDVSNDYLTGINGFDVDGRQNVIFNLSGQRVCNANKGVYIVNGKKISVK